MRLIFIIFLTLFSYYSSARLGVSVINRTDSGKTIILSIGALNEIKAQQKAVLVYVDFIEGELLKSDLIATVEAVKVDDNESIWFVREVFNQDALLNENKFSLLSPSIALKGRRQLKGNRVKIVKNSKQKTSDVINDFEKGWDESQLVSKDSEAFEKIELLGRSEFVDEDYALADVYQWVEKNKKKKKLVPEAIYRSPYKKEFEEKVRLETFEKMAMHYVKQGNTEFFNPSEFYQNMNKEKNLRSLRTTYATDLEEIMDKEEKNQQNYKNILEKGPRWSEDMSDKDLAKTLDQYGIAAEVKRRQSVFLKAYNNQFIFSSGVNLSNNQTNGDAGNGRVEKYDFNLGLEFHLFKNVEALDHLTLEWSIRRSFDGVAVGSSNATTAETSLALAFDYYPFTPPGLSERNSFFLGTILRTGKTTLNVNSTGAEAEYNTGAVLGLRTGFKYSFRNGLGYRFMLSRESLRLDKTSENDLASDLPSIISMEEIKFSAGVTLFF